ncbi:MAG: PD-(D/E)XK nuclease-like domain-containing protein [Candidatus Acidiferrales bacterium]
MKDQIYDPMPREEYDRIERTNFSTLKHIDRSPAHYEHVLVTPDEDTDAKKVGRVVHVAAFEPERFRGAIAVWEEGPRRGKAWEDFQRRNAGRELLTQNEYDRVAAMQKAVRANSLAQQYVAGGRGEVTMLWTYEAPGIGGLGGFSIPCKGRIDFDGERALADLKTTRSAKPEEFERQAWSMKYHVQAAWYSDAYEQLTGVRKPYVIVAVESEPPHIVQVYRVSEYLLKLGREDCLTWLARLNTCRREARWPAYADGELELVPPPWAVEGDDEDATGLGLVSTSRGG